MTIMLCVECLGPATITLVWPNGCPAGTYCQPCYESARTAGERIRALLVNAYRDLTMTPASEVPATLRG